MISQPDNGLSGQPADTRKVFVVHGRNEQIREAIFAFLRAIGLNPIEWNTAVAMTGKAAPYVGEILEAALRPAQAIVVVMTPDDEGRLLEPIRKDDPPHEKELTPQPRLNVVYETGLAMGLAPNRTVLVQIGKVKLFSDIQGVYIVHLDNTAATRNNLAQRLQNAHCPVDLKGNDWLNTGNFEIHEKSDSTPAESSGNDEPTPAVPDAQRDLEQIEADILKIMAKLGDKGYTASQLADLLRKNEQRVQYYLDKLCSSKHVRKSHSYMWGSVSEYYYIDDVGRTYLVERDIV